MGLSDVPLEEIPFIAREESGAFPWVVESWLKLAVALPFGAYLLTVGIVLLHESFHCGSVWLWRLFTGGPIENCTITLTHPARWGGLHIAYADLYFPTDHYWSVPLTMVFIAVIAWFIMDSAGD